MINDTINNFAISDNINNFAITNDKKLKRIPLGESKLHFLRREIVNIEVGYNNLPPNKQNKLTDNNK